MGKFKNKYRITSHRRPGWDYGSDALYFITICCKNRICYFGDIRDGHMHLSAIGQIAETEWIKTQEIRPDMNLWMGEYVIMPNHFHAIVGIGMDGNRGDGGGRGDDWDGNACGDGRDAMHCVSTANASPNTPYPNAHPHQNQFGPQSKNLASIVRGFKSAVTTAARKMQLDFAWQPNYHDHIIRNEESFHNISNYIINNIDQWDADRFNG